MKMTPILPTLTLAAALLATSSMAVQAQELRDGAGAASPALRAYVNQLYRMQSFDEDSSYDVGDSTYLYAAGKRAISGYPLLPRPVSDVKVFRSGLTEQDLVGGHQLLINALNNNEPQKHPKEFARALVYYDCWSVHQSAEADASHNMTDCRKKFGQYINMLDTSTQAKVVPGTVTMKLKEVFRVYFAHDHYDLTADAKGKLDAARNQLTRADYGKLYLGGHADTTGSHSYNDALSRKRAQTVADYLGLSPDKFEIVERAYGETNLPVPTADDVHEPRNRLVTISIDASHSKAVDVVQPQD